MCLFVCVPGSNLSVLLFLQLTGVIKTRMPVMIHAEVSVKDPASQGCKSLRYEHFFNLSAEVTIYFIIGLTTEVLTGLQKSVWLNVISFRIKLLHLT